MRFWFLATVLVTAIAISGSAFAAQGRGRGNVRFKEMDRNGDGRITRAEWRGSARSFDVHDWDGDGILSGDEVRQGAERKARGRAEEDFVSADREFTFEDWTVRGFRTLDHNGDNRIAADEWHFAREGFRRVDHNRDGVISRGEFLNENSIDDDRDDRFQFLDENQDGRIARAEWHGTADRFAAMDDDRNGFLTANEMYGDEPPADLFSSLDINRDGSIARQEWHWSLPSFDQRDVNRDGRLSRAEFAGADALAARSQTYRAGYERGGLEGRQAGTEDRSRNT